MKKSNRAKWKKLTRAEEKNIIADFEAGRLSRKKIVIKHGISSGQFYHIIRKTAGKLPGYT